MKNKTWFDYLAPSNKTQYILYFLCPVYLHGTYFQHYDYELVTNKIFPG